MSKKSGRPFAVFDIDGTLIRWQLYHAIADGLAKRGQIDERSYQAIKDARMVWKRRAHSESFRAYQSRLVEIYEDMLRQLSTDDFARAVNGVFKEYKDQVYTYTRDLIQRLKKDGYWLFAISGSQIEIVAKIAKYYGFDEFVGTTYVQKAGKFTGEAIFAFDKKDKLLKDMVKKYGASWKGSVAVGDTVTDIAMLELVEKPIAFNPESRLFEHARKAGWKIVIERKNMVYELEREDGKYLLA